MPEVAPVIIAAIITAATAAGTTLYSSLAHPGAVHPPGPNVPAAIQQEQQSRAAQAQQAQTQLPGLQESTGGGVSPAYLEQMAALNSGNANLIGTPQLQQAVQSFLGIGGNQQQVSGGGAQSGLMLGGVTNPAIASAASQFLSPSSQGLSSNPFETAAFA